jgi:hypothetical protein
MVCRKVELKAPGEQSDAVVDGSEIMKKNYYYRGSNHVLFRYLSYVP